MRRPAISAETNNKGHGQGQHDAATVWRREGWQGDAGGIQNGRHPSCEECPKGVC